MYLASARYLVHLLCSVRHARVISYLRRHAAFFKEHVCKSVRVAAGIFLLTNLAPNDWKNTQREQRSGDAMQELMEGLPDDEKATDGGKKEKQG